MALLSPGTVIIRYGEGTPTHAPATRYTPGIMSHCLATLNDGILLVMAVITLPMIRVSQSGIAIDGIRQTRRAIRVVTTVLRASVRR